MEIDIPQRNGMDQKNTADSVPVVDLAILSALGIFTRSSHSRPGAFMRPKRSMLKDFKRFLIFADETSTRPGVCGTVAWA